MRKLFCYILIVLMLSFFLFALMDTGLNEVKAYGSNPEVILKVPISVNKKTLNSIGFIDIEDLESRCSFIQGPNSFYVYNNLVYILDNANERIAVFNRDNQLVKNISIPEKEYGTMKDIYVDDKGILVLNDNYTFFEISRDSEAVKKYIVPKKKNLSLLTVHMHTLLQLTYVVKIKI